MAPGIFCERFASTHPFTSALPTGLRESGPQWGEFCVELRPLFEIVSTASRGFLALFVIAGLVLATHGAGGTMGCRNKSGNDKNGTSTTQKCLEANGNANGSTGFRITRPLADVLIIGALAGALEPAPAADRSDTSAAFSAVNWCPLRRACPNPQA